MNRVYRLVWNHALGVLQVTSELARAHGGAGGGQAMSPRRRRRAAQALLGGVLAAAVVPVLAHGGAGGDGPYPGSPGGAGGTLLPDGSTPQNGGDSPPAAMSPPGSGGSGGGGGGSAGEFGGAGGAGGSSSDQNGGKGGDTGLFLISRTKLLFNSIAAEAGGNGGSTSRVGFVDEALNYYGYSGGGGGEGGYGVIVNDTPSDLTVGSSFMVTGGRGGNGGNASVTGGLIGTVSGVGGNGGAGGDGGVGVFFGSASQGSTLTVGSAAIVRGGDGGTAGEGSAGGISNGQVIINGRNGAFGAGGAGVTGAGLAIINFGSIIGGMSGDGFTQANAVTFNGGANSLELRPDSSISGNVVAFSAADSFRLGGIGSDNFDVSAIGPKYQGFGDFRKTGASEWTLTGSTSAITPWVVSGGTLIITQDESLGAQAGGLTLDGGTLQDTSPSTTSARNITVTANGGTLQTDGAFDSSGVLSGPGLWTKSGTGNWIIERTNTLAGGLDIAQGSVQLGSVGLITLVAGVTANNGTALSVSAKSTLIAASAATGDGTAAVQGNDYTVSLQDGNVTGGAAVESGSGNGGNGGSAATGTGFHYFNQGTTTGGDGGGSPGGSRGGAGAAAISGTGFDLQNSLRVTGGNGGRVTDSINSAIGGAGGAGVSGSDFIVTSSASGLITGGGGGSAASFSSGGAGGAGVTGSGFSLTNAGTIRGGAGGSFSVGVIVSGGTGGNGVAGADFTVVNTGIISGGTGGVGKDSSMNTSYANGGVGISSTGGSTVTNANTISGGLAGNGARAQAVSFSGGGNTLILEHGYAFNGNVASSSGIVNGGDTLQLGGDSLADGGTGDAGFDTSQIGVQYTGFNALQKAGSSTWTLSGVAATAENWIIAGGTLVGDTASLNGNSIVNIADNSKLTMNQTGLGTFAGVISGTGTLTKTGPGTLTLTGDNTYSGGTVLSSGVLQIGDGGTTGSVTGAITNNASLIFRRSDTVEYDGVISGTGFLGKQNTGTLVLNGQNLSSGQTRVTAGTLQVNGTVAGIVSVGGGATLSGTGTVGTTTADPGATVQPGAGVGAGTLTVDGSLTMSTFSNLKFLFGSPAGEQAPEAGISGRVAVQDDVTLDGSLVLAQSGQTGDGAANYGYYRLLTYGGQLSGTPSIQATGSLATLSTFTLQQGNGHLDLLIGTQGTPAMQLWQGGSGTWLTSITNWVDSDGNVPSTWGGRVAVFKDTGSSHGASIEVQGQQTFQGLQFVDEGYALNGPGLLAVDGSSRIDGNAEIRVLADMARIDTVITGTGGITKTEAGTLVLGGPNSYAGGTVLDAGTVQVAQDTNLGAAGGSLTFNGGTLQTTGAFSTARAITLNAPGGTLQTDADLAVAGVVAGQGALVKTGSGTLALTQANTYRGGTVIAGGTLAAAADANLGDTAGAIKFDGGALRWDAAFNLASTRAIALAGGGGTFDANGFDTTAGQAITGSGSLTKTGTGALTLTGDNTYNGGTTVAAGTLQVGAGGTSGILPGNADVNGGATLVFHRSDDLTYGGVISGAGALRKIDANTLTLTGDSSAFTGATQVAAGGLAVNGLLGGTLALDAGTTLSGTGAVGTTTLAGSAILAPGNAATPVGTLNVKGDLHFLSGSMYQVQTRPGSTASSLVHASGTADLAGSVVQLGQNGAYAASNAYTILSADGGLHGTFDAVSSNLAFLAPTLAYDANNVVLNIALKQVVDTPPPDSGSAPPDTPPDTPPATRPIRFADAALTGNQRSVANALQSLPDSNALYTRVLNLQAGAPPAVFDALSGESYASTASTLQGVADNVANLPMAHLHANLEAGTLTGPPTAQLGAGDASSLPQSAAQPVWAQVFGNWRTLDGDGNAAKVKENNGGLFIGGDRAAGAGWRLGGALGYTDSHGTLDGRSAKTDADSYSAAIYGGKAFQAGPGKFNLSLGAAYTWHDIKTERDVNAAGQGQTLKSSYGASTGQVFTELGYALPLNDSATVEPFAGAAYSDLRTRAFVESGGDAALEGRAERNDVTTTTLGVHARTTFESGGTPGQLHGTLGWRHAFGDVNPTATLAFAGSQSFTVAGAPIARDAAVLELGVDMAVTKHTTVGVMYGGQFGAGNQQNAGTLEVRYRF